MIIGGMLGNILVKKVREDQFKTVIYVLLVGMGLSLVYSGTRAL